MHMTPRKMMSIVALALLFICSSSLCAAYVFNNTVLTIGIVWPASADMNQLLIPMQLALNDIAASNRSLPNNNTLSFVTFDSQSSFPTAVAATINAYKQYNTLGPAQSLIAIVGEKTGEVTLPMAVIASALWLPLIGVSTTSTTLSVTATYPLYLRLSAVDTAVTAAMTQVLTANNWHKYALIYSDDDSGRSIVNDLVQRAGSTAQLTTYSYPTNQTLASRDITHACNAIAASDTRIIIIHGTFSELVIRTAYSAGIIGGDTNHVLIGTNSWCSTSTLDDLADLPLDDVFIGSICFLPTVPTSAAYANFTAELNNINKTSFPSSTSAPLTAAYAYDAVWTIFTALSQNNIAVNYTNLTTIYTAITNNTNIVVNGITGPIYFNANGVYGDRWANISVVNYDVASQSFLVRGNYDQRLNVMSTDLTQYVWSDGTNNVPKDRPRVYVNGDSVPFSISGQMVVLAFVISVLGSWSTLILIEEAISARQSIHRMKHQTIRWLSWIFLSALCTAVATIWSVGYISYAAIQLDTMTLYVLPVPFLTSIIPTTVVVFIAFIVAIFDVKPLDKYSQIAAIDNNQDSEKSTMSQSSGGMTEVSTKSDSSSFNSGSNSHIDSNSNSSSSSSSIAQAAKKIKEAKKQLHNTSSLAYRINTFFSKIGLSVIASAITLTAAVMIIDQFAFVSYVGYYNVTQNAGAIIGACIFTAVVSLIPIAIIFHLQHSSFRFVAAIILGGAMTAQIVIIINSLSFTYAPNNSLPTNVWTANNTLCEIIAAASGLLCVVLMILNVLNLNRYRIYLDAQILKLNNKNNLITTELTELKKVSAQDQIDITFAMKNLEVINTCRTHYRPYALALALADINLSFDNNNHSNSNRINKIPATDAAGSTIINSSKNGGNSSKNVDEASLMSNSDANTTLTYSSSASSTNDFTFHDITKRIQSKDESSIKRLIVEIDKIISDLNNENEIYTISPQNILINIIPFECLKDILAKTISSETLACFIDIQLYKRIISSVVRSQICSEMFTLYILDNSPYEMNISSQLKNLLKKNKISQKNLLPIEFFDLMESEMLRLLNTNNYETFIKSDAFKLSLITEKLLIGNVSQTEQLTKSIDGKRSEGDILNALNSTVSVAASSSSAGNDNTVYNNDSTNNRGSTIQLTAITSSTSRQSLLNSQVNVMSTMSTMTLTMITLISLLLFSPPTSVNAVQFTIFNTLATTNLYTETLIAGFANATTDPRFPNVTFNVTSFTLGSSAGSIVRTLLNINPATTPGLLIFGDSASVATQDVALMATYLNKPHLICAASTPTLASRTNYPMSIRTNVNDAGSLYAALAAFQAFGWTKVAFIVSYDDLGWSFTSLIRPLVPLNMTVAFYYSRPNATGAGTFATYDAYNQYTDSMLASVRASEYYIIFVHGSASNHAPLMIRANMAGMMQPPYQWLGDSACDVVQIIDPMVANGQVSGLRGLTCVSISFARPRSSPVQVNWRYKMASLYTNFPLQQSTSLDGAQKICNCYESAYIIASAAQSMINAANATGNASIVDFNGHTLLPFLYNVSTTMPISGYPFQFTPGGEVLTTADVFNFVINPDGTNPRFDWIGSFAPGQNFKLIRPIVWSTGSTTPPLDHIPVYTDGAVIPLNTNGADTALAAAVCLLGAVTAMLSVMSGIRSKRARRHGITNFELNKLVLSTRPYQWMIVAAIAFAIAAIWSAHALLLTWSSLPSPFTIAFNTSDIAIAIIIPFIMAALAFTVALGDVQYRSLLVRDHIKTLSTKRVVNEKSADNVDEVTAFTDQFASHRGMLDDIIVSIISTFKLCTIRLVIAALLIQGAIVFSLHFCMKAIVLPANLSWTESSSIFFIAPFLLFPFTLYSLTILYRAADDQILLRIWAIILLVAVIIIEHVIDANNYTFSFTQAAYDNPSTVAVMYTSAIGLVVAAFEAIMIFLCMGLIVSMSQSSRNIMDVAVINAQIELGRVQRALTKAQATSALLKNQRAQWNFMLDMTVQCRPMFRPHSLAAVSTQNGMSINVMRDNNDADFAEHHDDKVTANGEDVDSVINTAPSFVRAFTEADDEHTMIAALNALNVNQPFQVAAKSKAAAEASDATSDNDNLVTLKSVLDHPFTLELFKDEMMSLGLNNGSNKNIYFNALLLYGDINRWLIVQDHTLSYQIATDMFTYFLSPSNATYPITPLPSSLTIMLQSGFDQKVSIRSRIRILIDSLSLIRDHCLEAIKQKMWNEFTQTQSYLMCKFVFGQSVMQTQLVGHVHVNAKTSAEDSSVPTLMLKPSGQMARGVSSSISVDKRLSAQRSSAHDDMILPNAVQSDEEDVEQSTHNNVDTEQANINQIPENEQDAGAEAGEAEEQVQAKGHDEQGGNVDVHQQDNEHNAVDEQVGLTTSVQSDNDIVKE